MNLKYETIKNTKYKSFVDAMQRNEKSVFVKHSWIGDIKEDITPEELKQAILDHNLSNKVEITRILKAITEYAKFCGNEHLLDVVEEVRKIGRTAIWNLVKNNATKSYISHTEFQMAMRGLNPNSPDEDFETNTLYYRTLFWAVYEGIFDYKMATLQNLRASDVDIEHKRVTLRDDNGKEFVMEDLPEQLLLDLVECSKISYWEQKRNDIISKYDMIGRYPDSCFKAVSTRAKQNLVAGYTAKLKKITSTYFDGQISPTHLYYSGIAHRISERFKDIDISVKEAFRDRNTTGIVAFTIKEELSRSHYPNSNSKFRLAIISHIESTKEEEI